jgi:hypothetical protein
MSSWDRANAGVTAIFGGFGTIDSTLGVKVCRPRPVVEVDSAERSVPWFYDLDYDINKEES